MRTIEIKTVEIGKIKPNRYQPREEFNIEKLTEMKKSMNKFGLLNPIIVRKHNEDYQIIAGERRWRALKALGTKEVQIKLVEATDIETEIMSIIENYHHEDLTEAEKEKIIYSAWIDGNIAGIFKNDISVMSEWTGISKRILSVYISAGDEHKASGSEIIKKASPYDLEETRSIAKISNEIREDLLKQSIEKRITIRELRPVIKAISIASKKDAPKDVIKELPALVFKDKLKPEHAKELVKAIVDIPKQMQSEITKVISQDDIIDTEKVRTFVKTLIESPIDVQEKLLKKEIDTEEAKIINVFATKEQREQISRERKIMKEESQKFIEKIKEDEQKNIDRQTEMRVLQASDIQQGKDPIILTKTDREKMKELRENSPEENDRRLLQFYYNAKWNLLFKADAIKAMNFERNKKIAIDIVWDVYERCYNVLIELGEIKVMGNINPRKSPVLPKRLSPSNYDISKEIKGDKNGT